MGLYVTNMAASGLTSWHDANPKVCIHSILPSGTSGGIMVIYNADAYSPAVDMAASGWQYDRVNLPVNVQGGAGTTNYGEIVKGAGQ